MRSRHKQTGAPLLKDGSPSPETNSHKSRRSRAWSLVSGRIPASVIVFTIPLACFWITADADFVFDDSEAIIGNKDVNPDTPLGDIFWHDFWGSRLASNTSHKSYRPLTVLTYRWSYWLAGGLHPRGFHIVNILLHALVCVLLLPVSDIVLGGQGQGQGHYKWQVLLSAIMFAVHPIHTESIAGVVGRADLLCAVTVFVTFLIYNHSLRAANNGNHVVAGVWLSVAMCLSAVAMLFKEQGVTVLGLCLVYDVIIHCGIDPLTFFRLRKDAETKNSKSLPWSRILVVMTTAIMILIGRWQIMGSSTPTFQVVDNPHSFVDNMVLRILNYQYLFAINAWILLCPIWLCFDWSMGCVPVIDSMLDPRLLAVAAFWFVMGILIGSILIRRPGIYQRSLMVSVAFLTIPFLPASNVLFRVGFVIAERALYLPSLGLIWILVLGLQTVTGNRKICWLALLMLLITHGLRSHQRSQDWLTEKALFVSGNQVCPKNAKVQYNIGKVYVDAGRIDDAIERYELALRLNPRYDQAMNNLGNILKDRGDLLGAQKLLLSATQIRPEFAAAWMNLAIVQASLNQSGRAEESYHTALKHRRNYPDCYYNLGNLYLSDGRHNQALTAWRNATLQKPSHISAWTNLIILLDNLGRLPDVEVVAQEALRYNPNEASLYYNLANSLGKAGRYTEAEGHFYTAIKLSPSNAMYYSNLAVLYHRWGRLDDAEKYYQEAFQLDPTNPQTRQNYDMLRKKRHKTPG